MRRLTSNHAPEAHDGIEPAALSCMLRGKRNLEGAGHPNHGDIVRRHAGFCERRQRARLKPIGDVFVVLRYDHREPKPRRASRTLNRIHVQRSWFDKLTTSDFL